MLDNDDLSALKSTIEDVLPLSTLMHFHMSQRFQLVTCFYDSSRTSPRNALWIYVLKRKHLKIVGTARPLGIYQLHVDQLLPPSKLRPGMTQHSIHSWPNGTPVTSTDRSTCEGRCISGQHLSLCLHLQIRHESHNVASSTIQGWILLAKFPSFPSSLSKEPMVSVQAFDQMNQLVAYSVVFSDEE